MNQNGNVEVAEVITPGVDGLHPVDEKIHKDLRRFMPQALSEYRTNNSEQPDARAAFEDFYQAVMKQISLFNARIEEVRRIDTDFPHDKRITKQMQKLYEHYAYFMTKLEPTLKEYEESFKAAEQAVEDAKRMPEETTLALQLRRSFREVEIRTHLENAGVNAAQLVVDAANAGRLEVLQTVTDSAFPCLPDDVMAGAYEIYMNKFQKDILRKRDQAQFFRNALGLKMFSLNRGVDLLSKSNFS